MDDRDISNQSTPSLAGTLSKWTNYIHGWQDRYIVLRDGTLTYYKSADETAFGCRGAIQIHKANVKFHEFDECRFDVSVSDCVWYLRAANPDERNKWVEALEAHRRHMDSAYGSDSSLRRHGSCVSLGSASITSFQKGHGLREKLAELETFRDILCRQVDTLQAYFDSCAASLPSCPPPSLPNDTIYSNHDSIPPSSSPNGNSIKPYDETEDQFLEDTPAIQSFAYANGSPKTGLSNHTSRHSRQSSSGGLSIGGHSRQGSGTVALDFKGEAITFKATTAGVLATLGHCIELLQQREELWKKRVEKEMEKRRKAEELLKTYDQDSRERKFIGGPDYEEGPHSMIKEEEFFDAVDAALDKHDENLESMKELKATTRQLSIPTATPPESCDHPLWSDVEKTTTDQLFHARLEVGEGGPSGWQLFAREGEMRLYTRELEVDGLVCDPLKAVHVVTGVTAHEVCHRFFSPDLRFEWENTLESMKVAEEINSNTLVFHQVHKRVWPAAQRDAVFWSHIRRVQPSDENSQLNGPKPKDIWIVCNHSVDRSDIPLGRCVRMQMTVSMTCETYIEEKEVKDGQISRDAITCKIIYCSTINPGGWAPASVLRALYKREYPKFLKRFTQYVKDATESQPIMW